MTPEKRVAVVLASLDPDVAAKVMSELDPHIMTKAAESIRNLGIVPGNLYKKALAESVQELKAYGDAVHGNDSLAVGLLSKVVGEQQAASMLELGQMAGNRFGALVSRKPEEIARMLAAESSSVIAVVLRFLPSQLASETLSHIKEEIRNKVVIQIATAELPPERVIDQIEQHLVARLPASVKRKQDDTERIDSLVSIMQRSSKEVADAMLDELGKQDPALADLVRDRMFVFEDIARLDDAAVRRIMQELENGVLSTALRKASDEVRDRFLSNMSRRAADGLQEEMEYAGKMPFSEVLAKQKQVVQVARSLAEQGEIKIGSSEEEYV
ncbi:flagellar motor switch protein FliG [Pontiella agarivorans]|uniref:Flagellar motor switch protein FliG n=1 Tax=Pontiella agarivorans TaxID=3038953 RepID=A0ABU5MT22_9BACT|nr:FliG C-terminal domain-containing protein [Pontiella agarivorans]MDZ8117281.1 FliG C-terminal domain-containing protein [Pontiella agarivorans]